MQDNFESHLFPSMRTAGGAELSACCALCGGVGAPMPAPMFDVSDLGCAAEGMLPRVTRSIEGSAAHVIRVAQRPDFAACD